ncbi:graves disease carrier protein-like [Trichogramma pretiosum]|uniref:graves disease carrier protein-like n=1 Tax=Trichogramma pretiosum TaxID=7493 RepID=UPI0006C98EDE|nr:graves disease carrier protein-like [Trichogramma pretiosum]XP_014235626.1 graves disease carrier protein-like [Trichogramma pretiosum]XP_014235627.1 graves disease carrier protein-like [Trichogramma pretiosum]XP_014235629.1 graves disease carrier protein-like [Trichogramma pretiosum]
MEKRRDDNLEFVVKNLFAGGIAGMCSKTAVAPLDRIKILLQAHNNHYKHLGVFSGLKEIIRHEKFFALYKGNFAQMIRIFPYAATQFTSFEFYKTFFARIPILQSTSHLDKFAAGACAGVTSVALTYPLDMIRARLAFQVTGQHVYSGITHTAICIFKEEGGLRALYRGFIPTVCGMIPYAGFSFYTFEQLKYFCMKFFPTILCKECEKNTGGLVLTIPGKLLCGGIAGAIAQSFSYPFDVTRRRMQLALMHSDTHKFSAGMLSTLKLIYNENGIMKGLYRGMSINYLRAVPMVAVSFSTYEVMKQMLALDTGMKI